MRQSVGVVALVFLIACGGTTAPLATGVPDVGATQTQGTRATGAGTRTVQDVALPATASAPTAAAVATATGSAADTDGAI